MINSTEQHIFFVDDEPKVRKAVGRTLEQLGSKVSCFACAADCLEQLRSQTCDLLITDVKMPEMDGIELLAEARRIVPWLQVLVITGYGDIPMAVKAVKAGALDFIEKPLDRQGFLSTVESALKRNAWADPLLGKLLSRTEMKVLRFILKGKSNKEIARSLHRSIRTIEDHRSNIFRKFGVDNLIDLFKRAAEMGLVDLPKNK
ncbi:Response regulator protein TmoT [subsurface metagenome]